MLKLKFKQLFVLSFVQHWYSECFVRLWVVECYWIRKRYYCCFDSLQKKQSRPTMCIRYYRTFLLWYLVNLSAFTYNNNNNALVDTLSVKISFTTELHCFASLYCSIYEIFFLQNCACCLRTDSDSGYTRQNSTQNCHGHLRLLTIHVFVPSRPWRYSVRSYWTIKIN